MESNSAGTPMCGGVGQPCWDPYVWGDIMCGTTHRIQFYILTIASTHCGIRRIGDAAGDTPSKSAGGLIANPTYIHVVSPMSIIDPH